MVMMISDLIWRLMGLLEDYMLLTLEGSGSLLVCAAGLVVTTKTDKSARWSGKAGTALDTLLGLGAPPLAWAGIKQHY